MDDLQKLIRDERFIDALKLAESRLLIDAYNLDLLASKAFIHRKMNEFDKAISTYNTLLNLVPSTAEIYAERGLTFHLQGYSKEALRDFDRAIELEPENGYRYSSRAFIRNYYGDHQGALDDYDFAITLDPDDAISLNNKGVIEEKLGKMKEAFESFSKSDMITGVDEKLEEIKEQPLQNELRHEKTTGKLTIAHFWQTFKQLVFSGDERKSFLRFLKLKK